MCSSEFNLQGTIMNYLPSKELLTTIRNDKYIVIDIDTSDIADSKIGYLLDNNQWYFINIYELAHKCKEWAFKQGYSIVDGIDTIGNKICYIMKCTGFAVDYYYEQTINYVDVFRACQWILDNRN